MKQQNMKRLIREEVRRAVRYEARRAAARLKVVTARPNIDPPPDTDPDPIPPTDPSPSPPP